MNDREYVVALEKGLAVLRAFKPDDRGLTIQQVAKRTMIGQQNVRRILLTFEALGYMARPVGGDRLWNREAFVPTAHVLELVRCIGVVVLDRDEAGRVDDQQVEVLRAELTGRGARDQRMLTVEPAAADAP